MKGDKTMKIAIIATIATVIIIALCGIAMADTYTKTAVVTAMEKVADELPLWLVTATDENGHMWDFFADETEEHYHIGDLLTITMIDMSGEHEESDEVADVVLIRTMTATETAEWLLK